MAGMIRNAYTAVLARGETWEGEVVHTEPYEAAWAAEAVFFVRVMQVKAGAGSVAMAQVQISPDGMHWVNEGASMDIQAQLEALSFARVGHFGGWLRLAVTVAAGHGDAGGGHAGAQGLISRASGPCLLEPPTYPVQIRAHRYCALPGLQHRHRLSAQCRFRRPGPVCT